ncbi:hypothetical protein BDY17DRAFT_72751 [Neohortaea acidophila]|uniref:Uncharacterized protein n=1 Tax=Neohortaea acidophila TaxID=245834 RepID=A0A6A6Q2H6_9PEZI|nr:uncharacterized protein BDY17DRAFT_72751 [Neohortaea acidophila]KAF2486199.1 hypothetical protein BDY17DRAFT_72751 [Neohortaea acidophila]
MLHSTSTMTDLWTGEKNAIGDVGFLPSCYARATLPPCAKLLDFVMRRAGDGMIAPMKLRAVAAALRHQSDLPGSPHRKPQSGHFGWRGGFLPFETRGCHSKTAREPWGGVQGQGAEAGIMRAGNGIAHKTWSSLHAHMYVSRLRSMCRSWIKPRNGQVFREQSHTSGLRGRRGIGTSVNEIVGERGQGRGTPSNQVMTVSAK